MIKDLKHFKYFIGIDEVNVFSLIGPVIAVAYFSKKKIKGVKDSKKLTYRKIKELAPKLKEAGLWSMASVKPNHLNIIEASQEAKRRAINKFLKEHKIPKTKTLFIIDGILPIKGEVNQICIPHGDEKIYQISAASIIAKEACIKYFEKLEKTFPGITKIPPTKKGAEKMKQYLEFPNAKKAIRFSILNKLQEGTLVPSTENTEKKNF
ncbi:MAG: hypothetical protein QXI58_00815 [Candidatus Micrarchaeia archaeon]